MKDKNKRKQNSARNKQYKAYSFHDVFGKDLKSAAFKSAYLHEMVHLRLARQMRKMRIAKKFTQKDVAQKAKMPQSVVARIESGKHSPSLHTIERIASVFDKKLQLV